MSEPTVPPGPPPAAPPPPPPSAGGTGSNKGLMLVLSYLGLLAIIPLLVEKDDAEVQWHAKHGLVLLVAEFAALIAVAMLSFALTMAHVPCGGCLIYWALCLAILVVHILCIVKAVNGQRFLIPGLSQYVDRF